MHNATLASSSGFGVLCTQFTRCHVPLFSILASLILYSQFRVIGGCHVKRVRVRIRFIHLLETKFLLVLQY